MEENYAAYWSAQEMLNLNNAYLDLRKNGIEQKLLKRRDAGLLLTSDYFEFISAFEQAERARIEFNGNKEQALIRLNYLTSAAIIPFPAIKPRLMRISRNVSIDIDQPDLQILQAQIENLQHVRETENWQGIESDFQVAAFGGPAIPHPSSDAAQFGYGGAVGFNIRMPLEIANFRKNEKSRVNNQLRSLHAEYLQRDQELNLEFNTLLNQYHQLTQQVKFQLTRLNAARESMRERSLRLQVLDGDVLEKYLQAINHYYRMSIELVETETEQWKMHIRLRRFITIGSTAETEQNHIDHAVLVDPLIQARQLLSHNSTSNTRPTATNTDLNIHSIHTMPISFAVYVWNYSELLMHSGFWKHSKTLGITRILLSLNANEIAFIASDATQLIGFLQNARHHGVKIELLLGDPDWILPKNRDHLLQIIRTLRHIEFDGLHLDIEPDQLETRLDGKKRLEAFMETVRQATTVSPWPVGISIHPRYLHEKSSYQLCIPCQLNEIGIREIIVMYYTMDIERIVKTLTSAMTRYPDLTFSLAQSLERELGHENSYAARPQSVFKSAMLKLHHQLQSANFGELIIQSWEEWKAYLYENSL